VFIRWLFSRPAGICGSMEIETRKPAASIGKGSMRYESRNKEFEGLECDLDGPPSLKGPKRDPGHLLSLILLIASLAAVGITGIFGLCTQNFIPLLVSWSVCSPFLTLLVRTHIAPFDGWP
jgi:hypothetical protein